MITTELIDSQRLFPSFSGNQARELSLALGKVVEQREKSQLAKLVTKEDFSELKQIVTSLAVAQQKTEQRIDDLVVAQQKTEQRIDDLVVAQQKTEQRIDDLVVAQEKTEQHLEKLTERVDDLAVAQQKTESQIQKLTKIVGKVQKDVGGIGNTFGYVLEDRAIKTLPSLLKTDFNIEVKNMIRDFIEYDEENSDEINILGYGIKENKNIMIVGEAKYQVSKKHIDVLKKMIKRVQKVKKIHIFPLFVCASAAPPVKKYAQQQGIKLYYSYQLEL
ncbi:hypothetical protein H8E88_16485 [candidate division KSB1 bacterium]|nr:hypothetical protein [candidate division KSB1 bacterium]